MNGQTVTVNYYKRDHYGRIVGKVLASGADAGLRQVEAGLAWHYKTRLSDTAIRKRAKANGWTRDLSGAVRIRVRESLVREGVRANLLAGVTPSETAIVDAAALGVEVVRWPSGSRPSRARGEGLPHVSKAI